MCISNVTDLSYLFSPYDENFNSIIPKYNINANLNNWDTSNVTIMEGTFAKSNFNGEINIWDVSNVIEMFSMFYDSSFNQNISNWNISSLDYIKPAGFDYDFSFAISNQPNFNGKPCDSENLEKDNNIYMQGICKGPSLM